MEESRPYLFDIIFYKFAIFIIFVASIVSFASFYLVFFPPQNTKINKVPVTVMPNTVYPGQFITFNLDYCKKYDAPSFITVAFVDTYLLPTFSTVRNFPTGCNVAHPQIQIPYTMKPGVFHMLISLEYKKTFYNVEHHEFDSENFTVLEATESSIILR